MRRVVHFATAAGTPVTSATETMMAQYQFGVSELMPGRIITWDFGAIVTGHTAGHTLTVRVRYGTSATPTSNTEILLGDPINVNVGDVILGYGTIAIQSATRHVHTVLVDNPHATGAIEDTTASCVVFTSAADTSYYLQITADWDLVTADSVQSECWTVWEDEV